MPTSGAALFAEIFNLSTGAKRSLGTKERRLKHLFLGISLSGMLIVTAGHAGIAALEIDSHATELVVSCERLSNGMLNVRSADTGFSEKDTNGDGFFFKATGFGDTVAIVFQAVGEEYKFGLSKVSVSELGFEAADEVRRSDGSKYAVDVKVAC